MGPYAWEHTRPVKRLRSNAKDPLEHSVVKLHLPLEAEERHRKRHSHNGMGGSSLCKSPYIEHDDLKDLPRSMEVFRKIEGNPSLTLMLPKPAATAGRVLEHAAERFTQMLRRNEPCTFKFGITVDPSDRWENYSKYSLDRFDNMIVLYAAAQPYGPAFLEAALISQFGSFLFAFCCSASCLNCHDAFLALRFSVQLFLSLCCCFTCAHVGPSHTLDSVKMKYQGLQE